MPTKPISQNERVLHLLVEHENGVCANTFKHDLERPIDRVAARVYDLKDLGWQIKTERCDLHPHLDPDTGKRMPVVKYRLSSYLLKRGPQ